MGSGWCLAARLWAPATDLDGGVRPVRSPGALPAPDACYLKLRLTEIQEVSGVRGFSPHRFQVPIPGPGDPGRAMDSHLLMVNTLVFTDQQAPAYRLDRSVMGRGDPEALLHDTRQERDLPLHTLAVVRIRGAPLKSLFQLLLLLHTQQLRLPGSSRSWKCFRGCLKLYAQFFLFLFLGAAVSRV
ncbi:hypothetical protein NDU88_003311 [Pleurodeles waltl]|uniref:Uncharacterized protein n=1 Tax=Pleurodeles waltl TaxID=8319 RepID=A0AAV7TN63_PLEWA|nr:hypothetical protein NDU88_003311 [Pleurodeles waltl]